MITWYTIVHMKVFIDPTHFTINVWKYVSLYEYFSAHEYTSRQVKSNDSLKEVFSCACFLHKIYDMYEIRMRGMLFDFRLSEPNMFLRMRMIIPDYANK